MNSDTLSSLPLDPTPLTPGLTRYYLAGTLFQDEPLPWVEAASLEEATRMATVAFGGPNGDWWQGDFSHREQQDITGEHEVIAITTETAPVPVA